MKRIAGNWPWRVSVDRGSVYLAIGPQERPSWIPNDEGIDGVDALISALGEASRQASAQRKRMSAGARKAWARRKAAS